MKKSKKIIFVLIATVAIVATLAINVFAFRGEGVGLYKLPNVSYFVLDRATDGQSVSYSRDTNFNSLNFPEADMFQNYLNTAGGDVVNSVRSRWKYEYLGSSNDTYHDSRFVLESASNNPIYNISIDLQNFPFLTGLFDYSRISLYQYNCYTVNNNFVYEPSNDVNNIQVSVTWTDCTVDPPITRRTYLYDYDEDYGYSSNLLSDVLARHGINDYESYELGKCFVNNISIQVDNSLWGYPSSYIGLSFYGEGFDFYRSLTDNYLSEGRYGFNDMISDLNYVSYQSGYDEGFDVAAEEYDYYYDLGAENAIEEKGMFSFFIESIGVFFSYPLFDLPNGGNISLGLMLGVVLGASTLIWILKLFAGG